MRSLRTFAVFALLGFTAGILIRCCVADARVDRIRRGVESQERDLRREGYLKRLEDLGRRFEEVRKTFEEHLNDFSEGQR